MMRHMLTTTDNPYDPFEQFDEWYAYDSNLGYHTPSYLSRVIVSSDELSDLDQVLAMETAIDSIIKLNGSDFYKKVSRDSKL